MAGHGEATGQGRDTRWARQGGRQPGMAWRRDVADTARLDWRVRDERRHSRRRWHGMARSWTDQCNEIGSWAACRMVAIKHERKNNGRNGRNNRNRK